MPKGNRFFVCLLRILFFLFVCADVSVVKAQGLKFSSNNNLISKRTSYRVFTDTTRTFQSQLHIDFDLMLWDQNHLGYILLVTDQENSYSLSYLNTKNTSSLNLNIDRVSNKLSIPLRNGEVSRHKWIRVQLDFDLVGNTVALCIDHKRYKATGFHFGKELSGNVYFGKNKYYTEVPDMAIKNVHVYNNQSDYIFPLNEWNGNVVHDGDGDAVGKVENPIWLINDSYFWTPTFQKSFSNVAGLNFYKAGQQLFIYGKDSLTVYQTHNNRQTTFAYKNMLDLPMLLGKSIINEKENKCYVYDAYEIALGKPSIAALDLETKKWTNIGYALLPTQRHHHNTFYNSTHDTIFLFGGYGAFKYHNSFYKYDKTADKWLPTAFNGDKINPRFFSASGPGIRTDEILLFGGYGNESGDQIIGGKEFYDLYNINLKTHIVKKLWSFKGGKAPFVPANNLILSGDRKYFYALCYPHEQAKTQLRLYKFSVKDGSHEIVSAPISVTSEKIETDINLFYDKKSKAFFCAVQEFSDPAHSHIKLYSLANPPVSSKLYYQSLHPVKKQSLTWWYVSGVLVIIIAGLVITFIIGRRMQAEALEDADNESEPGLTAGFSTTEVTTNAVYLLGEFMVYNRQGRDITYLFSPKIKQLFLLILMSDSKGISSKKISSTIWPEKEFAQTKNLRGVTFNNLRNILSELEGVQLQFVNDVYLFVKDERFFCDFFVIGEHLADGSKARIEENAHYNLLTRGSLLPQANDSWLDAYKEAYEEKFLEVLVPQLEKLYVQKQTKELLEIAKLILRVAPFNDEALRYELKAIKKLKGKEQAKRVYEQFGADYNKSFGEPYPISFEEISQ
ncbi:hypothetical protein [Mucilaginibacter lacusdianchii]|uniref:hypothetical protein n=1 Tax=Mucilaginibacter lacusdianchii TaxID=2684211 RepID=UPI00131BF94A|nr:hypothetical protein [Mucilaginibacter sp. JXJ CY 39]